MFVPGKQRLVAVSGRVPPLIRFAPARHSQRRWYKHGRPRLESAYEPDRVLTRAGLHARVRNPKSVRSWPEERMPGFPADQMSDREIGLVIGYLAHMTAAHTAITHAAAFATLRAKQL